MAASTAASVVWLTAGAEPVLISCTSGELFAAALATPFTAPPFAEFLVGLVTVFESGLLIVTEADTACACGLSAAECLPEARAGVCWSSSLFTCFAVLLFTDFSVGFEADLVTSFAVDLTVFAVLAGAAFASSAPALAFITLGAATSFATSFFAEPLAAAPPFPDPAELIATALFFAAGGAALAAFFTTGDIRVFAGFFIALAIESNLPAEEVACLYGPHNRNSLHQDRADLPSSFKSVSAISFASDFPSASVLGYSEERLAHLNNTFHANFCGFAQNETT